MMPTPLEKLAYICTMPRHVGTESPPPDDADEYDESDMDDRGEWRLTYGDLRAIRAELEELRRDIRELSYVAKGFDFDDLSDYGLAACGLRRFRKRDG